MNFLCKFSPTLERDSDEFAVELQDGDITSANPDRFTAGQNLFALEKALG